MPITGPSPSKIGGQVASNLKTAPPRALSKAANAAKKIHLSKLSADSGGDLRLSGVGRSGAKLGVKYTVNGDTVTIRETGPGHLIERPTSPHLIGPKRRRGRGRRPGVIAIPGVGFRPGANHPGTAGKATWAKGRQQAYPAIKKIVVAEMNTTVRSAAKP